MNYQDIFAATHKAGYNHFEGKTFTCKQKVEVVPNSGTTVDKGGIELFFTTGCSGKCNHISIISKDDENTFDVEFFDKKNGLQEFSKITETELLSKIQTL
jgi:hypothetical protein